MAELAISPEERKRLGQYFTGDYLARLLAALADPRRARTIIDPMGGSGDMLSACFALGARPEQVAAIEIDPATASLCNERLRDMGNPIASITGSAFDRHSWKQIPGVWDLVITNPPYVRYQSTASASGASPGVPDAATVRSSLLECIECADYLERRERDVFLACVEEYSGLADLAVPSWLLCASRVKRGGRLAIIVPDTWLSRDYAAPVLYVIRRFFDLEVVVSDPDAAWFSDALVRTTLVTARRVADKGSAFHAGGHVRIALSSKVSDQRSLVGKAFPETSTPEIAFAAWARAARSTRGDVNGLVEATWSDQRDLVSALQQSVRRHKWIAADLPLHLHAEARVSSRLEHALTVSPTNLVTLEQLGWAVGQGIRTGANDFFYVSRESRGGVRSALIDGVLRLPVEAQRPTVRRQAQLPADGQRLVKDPIWQVLMLEKWALPADMKAAEGPNPWKQMTRDLARLVRRGADSEHTRQGNTVALPDLSAVRTNVRAFNVSKPSRPARFWYQLPPLVDRHSPALYMARVNSRHPAAYLNPERSHLVDANFSTFWPVAQDSVAVLAMLSLLSSSWVQCSLELSGTVLGGGALKIEAAHLRRLLLPRPSDPTLRRLAILAAGLLVEHPKPAVLTEIDRLVVESVLPHPAQSAQAALEEIAANALQARS